MESASSEVQNPSANRDKRNPPCLTVDAEVLIYSSDGKAEFVKSESSSFNESILILDVKVTEGTGPMKGVFTKVETFERCDFEVQKYKQVTIRHRGGEKTIDVIG